jgi:tRNA A-37 threonylcarbamoyl transferase component Bud32
MNVNELGTHPNLDDIQAYIEAGTDPGGVGQHVCACPTCGTLAMTFRGDTWSNVVDPTLYEDKRLYRSGGMGCTFTARDVRIGREVIIKEPAEPGSAANAGAALRMERRLVRERRIMGLLEHPAIVPIYETGQWPDGTPFFVMRRIHGPTLAETIAAAERFADRIVLLPKFISIVEAIAMAHERGVVHRDLTPDNMMIGEHDEPYVIDWGIATLMKDADETFLDAIEPVGDGMTRGGVGKDPYASRDQRRGETPEPGFDVYSLGVTLHQLLGGRQPQRHADGDLEPLPREVPEELVSIVRRATDPEPKRRFATAGELADELRRYQQGKLVEAHRYTLFARLRRWAHLRRAAVAMVAAALLAGAGVYVAHVSREQSRAAEARAADAQLAAERARGEREAADSRAKAANRKRDEAMQKWQDATDLSKSLAEKLERQRRLTKQEVERLTGALEAERAAAQEAMDLRVEAEEARYAAEAAAQNARAAEATARAEAASAEAARQAADTARRAAEKRAAEAALRAKRAGAKAREAETKRRAAEASARAATEKLAGLERRAETAERRARAAERRLQQVATEGAATNATPPESTEHQEEPRR